MFLFFLFTFFLSAGPPAVVFFRNLIRFKFASRFTVAAFFSAFSFPPNRRRSSPSGTLYGLMPLQISLSSSFFLPPLRRCARSMLQRHIPQLFTPDRRRLSFLHKMTAGKIFIKFFPDLGENRQKKSRPREFSRGNGKKSGKIRTRGRRCRPGPGHCGRS